MTATEWADIQAQIAARQGAGSAVTAVPSPLLQAPATPISVVPVPAAAPDAAPLLALPSAAALTSAGVDAVFDTRGATIATAATSASTVGLFTSAIGDDVPTSALVVETALGVELVRPGVTEYFHSVPEGIEHGYVIESPVHTGDALTITVDVADGIPAMAGDDVVITRRDGTTVGYRDLYVFDATTAELPSFMSVAGSTITLHVDTAGAVYPITVDPVVTEDATVRNLANASGERAGQAVALASDQLVISVPGDDDTGHDRGKVELYDWDPGTTSVTFDSAWYGGTNSDSDYGYSVAFSEDGSVFAVGAPGDSLNGADAGAVYVYERNALSFQQAAVLYACSSNGCDNTLTGGGTAGDRFGEAIAINAGTTLVVGAPQTLTGGDGEVFVIDLATFTTDDILTGSSAAADDAFGAAVGIGGVGRGRRPHRRRRPADRLQRERLRRGVCLREDRGHRGGRSAR